MAVPAHWFHGTLDPIAPLQTVRDATDGMRAFELMVYEHEGHAISFTHGIEILRAVTQLD
ncbi:MAG: hypothetical protein ACLPVY_00580, partial [Acidimicrobiia bacterium]